MTNDLVVQDSRGVLNVADVIEQKRAIHEIMERVMKKDVHYGIIPGCQKPSMYQPCAELLCMTFRLAPSFIVDEIERPGEFAYRTTCNISTASGIFLGSAVGECSTSETKYMWRAAVCDEEFEATPENMRRNLWKKADKYHQNPYQVKQVRTNPADLANTASAISQKRAFVRAVRTVTAASDVFDVNLEDLDGVADIGEQGNGASEGHAPIERPKAKAKEQQPTGEELTVTGVIEAVSSKPTSKPGSMRTSCKIGTDWYATFSDTIAATLVKGVNVTIAYKVGQYGNDIISAVVSE
jgi:hypothetical protein